MSIISTLAKNLLEDIRAQQGLFTAQDRIHAVQELKIFLRDENLDDHAIVAKIKRMNRRIDMQGHFGIRGKSGSSFLRLTNEFLRDAEALLEDQNSDYDDINLDDAVKIMAKHAIADIEQKQVPGKTDESRFSALKRFSQVVNDHTTNYQAIEASAISEKNFVITFGHFGLWGKGGSHFLATINHFLHRVQTLITAHQPKNEAVEIVQPVEVVTQKPVPPVTSQVKELSPEEKLLQKHEQWDKEREDLEEQIKKLLGEHYGVNTPVHRRWISWVDGAFTGTIPLSNDLYFKEFDKELNQHADISEAVEKYRKIIDDKDYQAYYPKKLTGADMATAKAKFEYEKKKTEAELASQWWRRTEKPKKSFDERMGVKAASVHSMIGDGLDDSSAYRKGR